MIRHVSINEIQITKNIIPIYFFIKLLHEDTFKLISRKLHTAASYFVYLYSA